MGGLCSRCGFVIVAAISGVSLAGCAMPHACTARSPRTGQTHHAVGQAAHQEASNSGVDDEPLSDRVDAPWHFDLGLRIGDTKLGSAKQKLDRRLDTPLKLDVLGVFHSPKTPLDRKTDLGLNTFYVGVGRAERDWLVWTAYLGAGLGSDDEHQRFLNFNLSTKFHYQTYYAGLSAELYPWGRPRYRDNSNWINRLRATRPFFVTGFETGYVNATAKGRFAIAPLRLYEDHENIRDWLFSGFIGTGLGVPIDERWSLNLATYYSYHLYRPEEYNTWNFVTTLRYSFRTASR